MASSESGVAAGKAAWLRSRTTWQVFVGLVAFASLLPLVAVPVAHHLIPNSRAAQYAVTLSVFLGGTFHVAASGWFYTDPQMRSHFRDRPLRYFLVPALLIVGSAIVFQSLDHVVGNYLVGAYFAWQLWHYQRQNVGLLSFIAIGSGSGPITIWERRTLMTAAVAGILGFFHFDDVGLTPLAPQFAQAHGLGLLVYLAAAVQFAVALVESPPLRRSPLRIAFFLLGLVFFLPTYLFADSPSAIVGYALAHGLQYLVFMAVVSAGRPRPIVSGVLLLVIAAGGWQILDRLMLARDWHDISYAYAVYGAFLGVVMSHFVLDAGIWRLREPFQRAYMRDKFHFIFDRRN